MKASGNGWKFDAGKLISPGGQRVLALPAEVMDGSYQLQLGVHRLKVQESLAIALPIRGRSVAFILDGYPGNGFITGLSDVDGRDLRSEPNRLKGVMISSNSHHNLRITVRSDQYSALVTAKIDGDTVYRWSGLIRRLQMQGYLGTKLPKNFRQLGLLTARQDWSIESIRFRKLPQEQINRAPSLAADRATLLTEVNEIDSLAGIAPLAVFGPQAFPVVTAEPAPSTLTLYKGKSRQRYEATVIAAARHGKGRVVILGDGFGMDPESADNGQLFINAINWVSPVDSPKVTLRDMDQMAYWLKKNQVNANRLYGSNYGGKALQNDVVCLHSENLLGTSARQELLELVRLGKRGLIILGRTSDWVKKNPGANLANDHLVNKFLAPLGIVFSRGNTKRNTATGHTIPATIHPFAHAGSALHSLVSDSLKPSADRDQADWVARLAAAAVPDNDIFVRPLIKKWAEASR